MGALMGSFCGLIFTLNLLSHKVLQERFISFWKIAHTQNKMRTRRMHSTFSRLGSFGE
jgi:hypothetical protein